MKEQLRSYLIADPAIKGLVEQRVTWVTRPRGQVLPAIVLTHVSGARHYAMEAPSHLVTSRVQVDCWALNNKTATTMGRAVNAAMGGLRTMFDGVSIQAAFLESEQDLPDDASPPDEQIHRVSMDWMIWHTE